LESLEASQRLTDEEVVQPAVEIINPVAFSEPITRRRTVLAKTICVREKEHRRFVATQPCLICGRSPADAHHLRFVQPRALGRKVSDEFTVPVCRAHHREIHSHGDEVSWWKRIDLDPLPIALKLWQYTRRNGTAITEIKDNGNQPTAALYEAKSAKAATTLDIVTDVRDTDPIGEGRCPLMTSLRQIEANRCNATNSTRPKTAAGKMPFEANY
jgi:hypothetical protein